MELICELRMTTIMDSLSLDVLPLVSDEKISKKVRFVHV